MKHVLLSHGINRIKASLLLMSLFYLTVYLPFAVALYFPHWHRLNCRWNDVCYCIGEHVSSIGISELNAFFWHRGEFTSDWWTEKEKRHLTDVRQMADRLFGAALVAAAAMILLFEPRRVKNGALINIAIILSCLAILPFFGYFWRHIFHPLLFENRLWLNTRHDFSFYLMPRTYFKSTTAFLIVTSCIINLGIWLGLRKT